MSSYSLVLFVHIASAVVLVGGGLLATPAVNSAIRQVSTVSVLRGWLATGRPLGWINPLSSMTLLASGVYLASLGEWWAAAWVQIAVALWIVNLILANVLVKPSIDRVVQLSRSIDGESISEELDRARKTPRLAATSDVMLATDLDVLFLMVVKPSGYLTGMLVVIVVQLGLLVARGIRRPVLASEGVRTE